MFALTEWDSTEMRRSKIYKALVDTAYNRPLACELLGISGHRLLVMMHEFKIFKPHRHKVKTNGRV